MALWKNDEELFSLIREKLYTPVVGDILDQMGYTHQFLPMSIRPLTALVPPNMVEPMQPGSFFTRPSLNSSTGTPNSNTWGK